MDPNQIREDLERASRLLARAGDHIAAERWTEAKQEAIRADKICAAAHARLPPNVPEELLGLRDRISNAREQAKDLLRRIEEERPER